MNIGRALALIVLLSGPFAHAALATMPATVPAGWKPIPRAQFGEIHGLFVRDGHLAWVEAKLDERTASHRAESFWFRIFRRQLDDPNARIEDLTVLKQSTTSGPTCILGPAGAMAWNDRYKVLQFAPARSPATTLPAFQPDYSFDNPIQLYADALLTSPTFATESGLALIPLEKGKPQFGRRRVIVPWQEARKQNVDFPGDVFKHGDFIVFTQRPRDAKNLTRHGMTVVWQMSTGQTRWTAPGLPIGIDEQFVYAALGRPIGIDEQSVFIRRYSLDDGFEHVLPYRLAGDGRGGERIALPWRVHTLVDFDPPVMLALRAVPERKRVVASRINLADGKTRDFRFQSDRPSALSRSQNRLTNPLFGGPWPGEWMVGDAATDTLLVTSHQTICRVQLAD